MLYICDSEIGVLGFQRLLSGWEVRGLNNRELELVDHFSDGLMVRLRGAGIASDLVGVGTSEIAPLVERTSGRLLVLTETLDFEVYARLFASNVRYMLPYGAKTAALTAMLEAMQRGEMESGYLQQVKDQLQRPQLEATVAQRLTTRECQIAAAIGVGLANKQIANVYSISYETVKEHVQHVLRKLECRDRTSVAVRIARSWRPSLCA